MAAPPRKRVNSTPGHPKDIKIGICRGMGLSREDTAVAAECSVHTVDLRKDEPTTVEWETWAAGVSEKFKTSTQEKLEAQMRRRVGRALDVIDKAVANEDLNLALKGVDRVLDRAFGKATQKVETTSDVTERHVFEIPEATLSRIQEFAASLQPKRIAAADVIDVEVEPTDDKSEGENNGIHD